MINNKCKICRRVGQKLFLKGERCFSPKCAMIRHGFPPGPKRKRRSGAPSEYKKALLEKQKLRKWYGLTERQFSKYVKDVLAQRGKTQDIGNEFIGKLERRLDNVIFKLGLSKSKENARQLVSHGHFMIDGKSIDIPSFEVKKGNIITIKESKKNKAIFKEITPQLKNKEIPSWLEINKETLTGKVKGDPSLEEVMPPAEVSVIFEFYSR